jgi:hypothetical protein
MGSSNHHLPERPGKCKTYPTEPICSRAQPVRASFKRLGPANKSLAIKEYRMNNQAATSPMTLGEQETENEANRLTEQVEAALAAVALRTRDSDDSLEAAADRIERAARDLSDALRELSKQRRSTNEQT